MRHYNNDPRTTAALPAPLSLLSLEMGDHEECDAGDADTSSPKILRMLQSPDDRRRRHLPQRRRRTITTTTVSSSVSLSPSFKLRPESSVHRLPLCESSPTLRNSRSGGCLRPRDEEPNNNYYNSVIHPSSSSSQRNRSCRMDFAGEEQQQDENGNPQLQQQQQRPPPRSCCSSKQQQQQRSCCTTTTSVFSFQTLKTEYEKDTQRMLERIQKSRSFEQQQQQTVGRESYEVADKSGFYIGDDEDCCGPPEFIASSSLSSFSLEQQQQQQQQQHEDEPQEEIFELDL